MTAFLSSRILGVQIPMRKWLAVFAIMIGVLIPTLSTTSAAVGGDTENFSPITALVVIVIMNLSTSSAGVYGNWLLVLPLKIIRVTLTSS